MNKPSLFMFWLPLKVWSKPVGFLNGQKAKPVFYLEIQPLLLDFSLALLAAHWQLIHGLSLFLLSVKLVSTCLS